jgi:hypothetical protein
MGDNIKIDIKEREWQNVGLITLGHGRGKWRGIL